MTTQHYTGSCQCGAVRYEVDVDLDHTITCNCSRCGRLGLVLAFAPEQAFDLKQGEGATTEYLFNTGKIHHRFCSTCGVESFARGTAPDGKTMMAINVRCLDGVDPSKLSPTPYDGASV
ncbi:aldehyde-activating protein [Agaricicola taiwanensis]|uniref:Aldehyde-activating protein n=1 Tax=Agaricicola taiwanensis TaxID=591372 RepID=A0A8J2VKL7_9RHOB|nr:GFA family protein [Agaricicola taiwanensis]GGE30234.1 aldehyde-activating protein [Agaricicola taiwanensis]